MEEKIIDLVNEIRNPEDIRTLVALLEFELYESCGPVAIKVLKEEVEKLDTE